MGNTNVSVRVGSSRVQESILDGNLPPRGKPLGYQRSVLLLLKHLLFSLPSSVTSQGSVFMGDTEKDVWRSHQEFRPF